MNKNVSPPRVGKNLSNSFFGKQVEIYAFLWKVSPKNFLQEIEFWTNVTPPGVGKNLSNTVLGE